MKYTKGEWTPIEFKDTCDFFKGGHIQVVGDNQRSNVAVIPMHWDNAKANAKLIAQSPRMAEWVAKITKQGFVVFPEDKTIAREIIQTLDLS